MYVAFFRNLNLGRPRCPSREEFERAFLDAGATSAASFLVNGTMVFGARGAREAKRVLTRASVLLRERNGLEEPAFLRTLPHLVGLVASEPFAEVDRTGIYDVYVTFLDANAVITEATPRATARRDVEVVQYTATEALSISRAVTKSPGSPSAFLEKTLGLPTTTRAWNTVVRLVAKHG